MNRKGESAGKSHSPTLNFVGCRVIYVDPRDKQHHTRCDSLNDRGLYRKYLKYINKQPENSANRERRSTVRNHSTV